jgi:hypothetical protein
MVNLSEKSDSSAKIPRIFHFITGLDANFGGRPISFVHYMAIRSALEVNKGFCEKIYYHYEPSCEYWDAIKRDVELIPVAADRGIWKPDRALCIKQTCCGCEFSWSMAVSTST